jgi:hypothetical protein
MSLTFSDAEGACHHDLEPETGSLYSSLNLQPDRQGQGPSALVFFFSLPSSNFSWGMYSMLEKCGNSLPLWEAEFQPMAVRRRGEKRGML